MSASIATSLLSACIMASRNASTSVFCSAEWLKPPPLLELAPPTSSSQLFPFSCTAFNMLSIATLAFSSPTSAEESSAHVPQNGTSPSTTTITRSTRFKKCDACVTSKTAAPARRSSPPPPSSPRRPNSRSKTRRAVPASSALNGSSNSAIVGLEYTARASDTRCFCPPDSVTPRSPISVMSPAARRSMSVRRQHASRTLPYRTGSYAFPNSMLSRRVAFSMNATWLAYATSPPTSIVVRGEMAISPMMAFIIVLFPPPTGPTTASISPGRTDMFAPRTVKP
mmetsp:Transcript_12052/g.29439  ORF Transcript_12052/g.29439 Transcript_12052/m.29439 type:complete len:282 (-) Transcript_12052:289-1134(-)